MIQNRYYRRNSFIDSLRMDKARNTMYFAGLAATATLVYALYHWWKRREDKNWSCDRPDVNCVRETIVVESQEQWEEICPLLLTRLHPHRVLGFDCEWVTIGHSVQPVSLIQIADPNKYCVLVRINCMQTIPESLRSLLADRSIYKAGVACVEDAKKLHKDYSLVVRGCIDLRNLAIRSRTLKFGNYSLKVLASKTLGVDLNKGFHVRCSNWENTTLSPDQVKYAALDAIVGVEIFKQLIHNKMRVLTTRPSYTDDVIWQKVISMCQGIVDSRFLTKGVFSKSNIPNSTNNYKEKSSKERPIKQKPISRAYSARTKPLYDNCQLWAPDGQLLCNCDLKKANWYMEKGLGVKVQDEPVVVQLNFEPSGRPVDERNYYLHYKENICVVCGQADSYIRKNVVPHEYRKHFPALMKDHLSHDVVLLCLRCHQQASVCDSMLKQQLEKLCDAPSRQGDGKSAKYSQDPEINKIKSAAKALYLNKAQIPEWRVRELEEIIKDFYGVYELTLDVIEEAMNMDPRRKNSEFTCHGEKVVKYMVEHDGLVQLEIMWRTHFLESMKPQYLPDFWSVTHNHDRLQQLHT